MADAKIALSHAVRLAADYRSEVIKREAALEELEQKSTLEIDQLKEELQRAERSLASLKHQHHLEIMKLEKERQENFGTLLQENKENLIEDELRKKQFEVSTLQDKLDTILSVTTSKTIRRKRASVAYELEDLNISSDGKICPDDEIADPTWRQTPLGKRLARLRASPTGQKKITFGEPLLKCACRSACATTRCMCFSIKKACHELCGCDPVKCKSKLSTSFRMENSTLNQTYNVDEDEPSLSKRRKVSGT